MGESDTDSFEFPAIHTPVSDSGEEIDDDIGGNSWPIVEKATTLNPLHEVIAVASDVARAAMAKDSGVWTKSLTKFRSMGCLMLVVPKVMKGAFTALGLSVQEAAEARAAGNVKQETRAWKLFLLVPRMLLTKPLEAVFFFYEKKEWNVSAQQNHAKGRRNVPNRATSTRAAAHEGGTNQP